MAESPRPKKTQRSKASNRQSAKSSSQRKATKPSAKAKAKPADKQPKSAPKLPPPYQLMKALGHPLRLEILAILADDVASPTEMARQLNERVGNVCYHVNVLRDYGLVVDDKEVPRRGAVEHFFRAAARTVIPPGAWDNLPDAVRKGVSVRILEKAIDDVRDSMEAGVFDDPPGELSWTPLILDQLGVEELGKITRKFIESSLEVQANASKRMPKSKGQRAAVAKSATVFVASFSSARNPKDDQNAAAMKRR